MKSYLLLLFLITLNLNGQYATFDWATTWGSSTTDDRGDIAIDSKGYVYEVGKFIYTQDFDPGPGTYNLTSTGSKDVFVRKLDPAGNLVWAVSFGGNSSDEGNGICVDKWGNVYTTGYYRATADFDPDTSTYNVTPLNWDVFVHKLDSSGNFVWVRTIRGNSNNNGNDIAIDSVGNVYTIGQFAMDADFDPDTSAYNLTSSGIYDIFIQKLDSAGNFQWAKKFGGSASDFGNSITIDSEGNVLGTGEFAGTVDFDPGPALLNLTAQNSKDIFLLKLSTTGSFQWAKSFTSSGLYDYGSSISVDSKDNIFVHGHFSGTIDLDPDTSVYSIPSKGGQDVFTVALDNGGTFMRASTVGGSGNDYGGGIAHDPENNLYITGGYQNTADFDPSIAKFNMTSGGLGGTDVFIQKLDSLGNFIWAKSFGGSIADQGHSIVVDQVGNVYTGGTFNNTPDFDPGTSSYTIASNGFRDVFLSKMTPCTPYSRVQNITACDSYTWDNGVTYTTSTNTPLRIKAGGACDSLIYLNLAIRKVSYDTSVVSACDSYTWIDGITYTASTNSATFTLTNNQGCDSIVNLVLSVSHSTSGTDSIIVCDSLKWIDGITYTTNNYSAITLLTNSIGCDSVVTLNLTIMDSPVYDSVTTCSPFTWINGITYTSSNFSASDTLTSSLGCDSVVHLQLKINQVDTGVLISPPGLLAKAQGALFQWITCANASIVPGETNQYFIPKVNGSYAVVISQNGCIDTSACFMIDDVGIQEVLKYEQIVIYPNPNTGKFTIDLGSASGPVTIQVVNAVGQLVFDQFFPNTTELLNVNLSGAPGLYNLNVVVHGDTKTFKVIKH